MMLIEDDPTSVMTAPPGTVHAGMRQFVAALDPKKPAAVRLLAPKEFLKRDK
jgi:hypothetical protein